MAKMRPLETAACPFANLPEARSGRWGEGLTAEKMKECVGAARARGGGGLRRVDADRHLRHPRFVRMWDRRKACEATRSDLTDRSSRTAGNCCPATGSVCDPTRESISSQYQYHLISSRNVTLTDSVGIALKVFPCCSSF